MSDEPKMMSLWSQRMDERQTLQEFWEWLLAQRESQPAFMSGSGDVLDVRIEDALDAYHGIDRAQLERERRAMLAKMQHAAMQHAATEISHG